MIDPARWRVFGEWDAPMTDGVAHTDELPDATCIYCDETFKEGDNGAVLGWGAQHRECSFRAVMGGIGHHVNHSRYCRSELGPDAGLSHRQSALLTWSFLLTGLYLTEEDLDQIREGGV